jgi:rhodanese-related sulfurtransferase
MRYPDVATMNVVAVQTLLHTASSTSWLILDARSLDEFTVSHLPGAVPLDTGTTKTDGEIDKIAGSKNRPILVVCSVGLRSAKQALKLQSRGFMRVTHLEGGLFEWVNQGHSLVRQGKRVHEVHPYNLLWGLLLRPPHE